MEIILTQWNFHTKQSHKRHLKNAVNYNWRGLKVEKEKEKVIECMEYMKEYFTHHTCTSCVLEQMNICDDNFKCPAYWDIRKGKDNT